MIVDRYNRRLILLITSSVQAAIGVALLVTVSQSTLSTGLIFALLALQSAVGTFQPLAELASVGLMVPKESLTRANSMLAMNEDISQVVAPILGGFLLVTVGIRTVLLVDVASFLIAAGALLFICIPNHVQTESLRSADSGVVSYIADFRQSLSYLRARPTLLQLVLIMALLNFCFTLTLPLVAPMVLERTGNDTVALGFITAGTGIGAVLGGVLVATRLKRTLSIRQIFLVNAVEALLIQVGFGLAQSTWLSGMFRFLPGLAAPLAGASYQTFWQTAVPQALQGRVFAVRRMLAVSLTPLALILSGVVADLIASMLASRGLNIHQARLQSFQILFIGFGLLSTMLSLVYGLSGTFKQLNSETESIAETDTHPA